MGILASLLSGAGYGTESGNMVDGAIAGANGQFYLAVNVASFEDLSRFKSRVDAVNLKTGTTMWGAIIGDIVGSAYERSPYKTKVFEFFGTRCTFTDDSVCTAAVAASLLDDLPPDMTLRAWCRRHPGRGYGGMFAQWLERPDPQSYGSYGNGAAMRVSPAAYFNRGRPVEEALRAANEVTAVTHDHPEGMKGARAAVHATWLAFEGVNEKRVRRTIEHIYGYDLSLSVDEIRPRYRFDTSCQGTVPEAITCALESRSFEDAVRNAVSLGGDSDTLAAIAGPIAEAMHGIPEELIATAKERYLAKAPDIVDMMERLYLEARSEGHCCQISK